MRIVLTLIILICIQQTAISQNAEMDTKVWSKKLTVSTTKNENFKDLKSYLLSLDSTEAFKLLFKIGKTSHAKGPHFVARYNCLKASCILKFNPPVPDFSSNFKEEIKKEVIDLLEDAIKQAYISDDDHLIAFVSFKYGDIMKGFQKTAKAVMYLMYSADLYDQLQLNAEFFNYFELGELLWKIREYKKCIYYTKKAISVLEPDSHQKIRYEMMCNNTVGLAYQRMGRYDSAIYFYQKALRLTSELNDPASTKIWTGIISGNMAQIDFAQKKYSVALPLFEIDYNNNKEIGYYGDAANSLQWAAKTNLALGDKKLALDQIRESFELLEKWPTAHEYIKNAYKTASEIFKSLDNNDSALYYSGKYNFLHDSLERVIYQSSLDISQLRLNYEKDKYKTSLLRQKKDDQLHQRNFIIGGVILFSAIILLLVNRQRQKLKLKHERDQNENLRIQNEIENARVQLKMFTNSTIEKTNIIEKLELQVKNKLETEEQNNLINELCSQTILTEEDWLRFKQLFEKINPSFFNSISNQVLNITPAEQRMAALILLHLTTKQMAAVLGISPNSVLKSKQRLRHRLNFSNDQQVEEFIKNI